MFERYHYSFFFFPLFKTTITNTFTIIIFFPLQVLKCKVCGTEFNSKNKLFTHLKAAGHAAIKTGVPQAEKKARGKNKK